MSTSPSIFDQYRQSVAALPPPPTPNLAGMAGPTSPGGVPSNLSIPMPAPPNVSAAPTQLQKDQQHYQDIKMKGPGEEQIYHAISGSKLGQNHPILGKVLGGLAAGVTGAADIGVGTLGGGLGRLAEEQIPGTLLNHQVQLNRAGKDIATDEADAGKEAQTREETASGNEDQARANSLNNPPQKEPPEQRPYTISTDKGELQWDGAHWSPIQVNGETVNAPPKESATHLQKVEGTDGTFANYNPATGEFTDQTGKQLPNFKAKEKALQGAYGGFGPAFLAYRMLNSAYNENPALLPYIAPLITKMLSQSGGGAPAGMEGALSTVPVGQPQNDAGTPIGLRMPGAPTGATRSRGQFAGEVLPTMHEAGSEIDNLGGKLGPFMGRISDLVTGKIGAYGPEFSALQTDLHNIATGWGRLHGNSVETMKQFYDDLNASKDPANLKAKLAEYEKQAEIYKKGGEGQAGGGNAPKVGDKKNGFTFDGTGWTK